MLHSKKIRDQKGAAITGLVIALMFFILMSGLFCFDASRVQMAQRELTATCDASALAGTAMLTSYDVSNDPGFTKLADAQHNAAAFSYNMFNMGNVLGRFLQGNTQLVTNLSQLATTTDGEAKVVIGLVDPQNSYQVIPVTPPLNQNGRAIAVFAGYGYHPIFISFYGVGNVGILASSIGGLPQVDAILVFDYSGSMDDLTQVSLIKRWWNPNPDNNQGWQGDDPDTPNGWSVDKDQREADFGGHFNIPGLTSGHTRGCIQYDLAPPALVNNKALIEYVDLDTVNNIQGHSLNALPPQNLAMAEVETLKTGDNILVFKRFLRHHRNRNDYDSPPGNCPALVQSGGVWTNVNNDLFAYHNPGDLDSDHFTYPDYSSLSGTSGLATTNNVVWGLPSDPPGEPIIRNSPNIYTDLIVNIKHPGVFPPVQPLFGDPDFSGFTVRFPSSEDDGTIRNRTYRFDNIATVVEAARGNRERTQWRDGTGLHRGYVINVDPIHTNQYFPPNSGMNTRRGYQKAYQRLAMWVSQPIASAVDGADQGFFQKLSALADCRFGFVGFSDSDSFSAAPNPDSLATPTTGIWAGAVGTPAFAGKNSMYYDINYIDQTGADDIIDTRAWNNTSNGNGAATEPHQCRHNQGGGRRGFRIPRAELTANGSITQSQSLNWVTKGHINNTIPWSHPRAGDGLYNGRPLSGTMCAEALDTARLEFQGGAYDGLSRAGSKRAIVFFTDGIPSGGISSGEASASQSVADQCQADGVAMYTIGLNMLDDPTLKTQQETFLGNGSGGLAGRAKNGGRFFGVQDVTGIKQAFSAIARRLTQSQR